MTSGAEASPYWTRLSGTSKLLPFPVLAHQALFSAACKKACPDTSPSPRGGICEVRRPGSFGFGPSSQCTPTCRHRRHMGGGPPVTPGVHRQLTGTGLASSQCFQQGGGVQVHPNVHRPETDRNIFFS